MSIAIVINFFPQALKSTAERMRRDRLKNPRIISKNKESKSRERARTGISRSRETWDKHWAKETFGEKAHRHGSGTSLMNHQE